MGTWKSVAKVVTYPFAHPTSSWQWIKSSSKVAAVTLPATYIGWEKLTTDKSVCRIVGEATVGEKNVNRMDAVAGDLDKVHKSAGKAIDKVSSTLSDVDSQLGGAKKFFQELFGGNGVDMFGNFFSNLGEGKVSGLSIVSLVAAAFMVFGHFGWFGKIAGALLPMFIIGNNSDYKNIEASKALTPGQNYQGIAQKEKDQEDENKKTGLNR